MSAQEVYLDAVQPVAMATLRQLTLEADASARGLDPTVRKALRRRARLASRRRRGPEGERGTIFTVQPLEVLTGGCWLLDRKGSRRRRNMVLVCLRLQCLPEIPKCDQARSPLQSLPNSVSR